MADAPKPPPGAIDPQVAQAVGDMMQNAPPTPAPPPAAAPASPSRTAPVSPSDAPAPGRHHQDDPPPDTAPFSKLVRYWIWKYVGTLVMEQNQDGEYVMSLGRVSTAALLAQAMWRWGVNGADIPQSMLQTLWILLGYLLGTKGIVLANAYLGAGKADAAKQAP